MAHYAFLNEDNVVIEVITGKDENDLDTLPEGFSTWEEYYLSKRPNANSCLRTSYNTTQGRHKEDGTVFRGNFAAVDGTYDPDLDIFIPPKPYPEAVWNETILDWDDPS